MDCDLGRQHDMTTFYQKSVTCAICNHSQIVKGIASTNSFGSSDLDTRPPEMKRSTMFTWVQVCPSCGYCADDLQNENLKAPAIIKKNKYKQQLNNPNYPDLANAFLCKALIESRCGDFAKATWSLLHAAWACDDREKKAQAVQCRQDAVKMLLRAERKKQILMNHRQEETLLLIDLLRRSGQFTLTKQVIASRRQLLIDDPSLFPILKFQSQLIEKEDWACYTITDAFSEREET